ncbi:MAG: hypothetical protein K6D97_00580 [Clostridia bacterium]|nr:hypothetical protein [Clostridia bacterium]
MERYYIDSFWVYYTALILFPALAGYVWGRYIMPTFLRDKNKKEDETLWILGLTQGFVVFVIVSFIDILVVMLMGY